MTYTLLIVESPAKCKKIEEYLGSGYKCIASFGHITELDGGLESIDIENNFAPRFKTVDSKEQQISKIKKAPYLELFFFFNLLLKFLPKILANLFSTL